MDLYQVCSNYGPGVNNGPALGNHMFNIDLYRVNAKIVSCPGALIFDMKHHLVDTYVRVKT